MASPSFADDSLQTRASLLKRLRDLDDAESWSEFYRTYERAVRGLARKRGLSEAEAEEVAQEVFQRIAATIHNFEPTPRTGAFRRWLYQLARWRADDKLRERRRAGTHEPLVEHTTTGPHCLAPRFAAPDDIEAALEADARRKLLNVALERLRHRISPRDLQIYRHLVAEEWPVSRIASFFRIAAPSVYVIRHRVGRLIRTEIERIQRTMDRGLADPGLPRDA